MAQAQVPPDIAKQLVAIGRGVCVPQTAQLYRPLHSNPPYKGVSITRDVKFGPDPMDVLDVFAAEKGGGSRPVLIYVSGGAGNKLQGGPNGDVFYDNIMLWATKNGMVGVNMQRHGEQWSGTIPAKPWGWWWSGCGIISPATRAIRRGCSSGRSRRGTPLWRCTSAIRTCMDRRGSL